MAERITPTFIIKLVVLFALLLVGVFVRSNQMAIPADAASVQLYEQPTHEVDIQEQKQDLYHKVTKRKNATVPSI